MDDNLVRGHMCDGLKTFQSRIDFDMEACPEYSCIPNFRSDGTCEGCDSTNHFAIIFCPFCGVYLGN